MPLNISVCGHTNCGVALRCCCIPMVVATSTTPGTSKSLRILITTCPAVAENLGEFTTIKCINWSQQTTCVAATGVRFNCNSRTSMRKLAQAKKENAIGYARGLIPSAYEPGYGADVRDAIEGEGSRCGDHRCGPCECRAMYAKACTQGMKSLFHEGGEPHAR